ncbi:PREDICTED: uncharacterized protein LOC106740649 isoform X2 [Dinoponera quadriceps]|uniref:Uncharacterized protein LOC106740649 isoform X2 n=1 Tax=Dinoponera quadriceps TaxID=609295 RepID=A0A6P3WMQ4_DINQU|nr:PREDICTED: uncharacterized protein LOC106740649 isoform X2 [Dinoponera quadriceps]
MSINSRKLLIAASESDLEEMDRLIKRGVSVNSKDRDGNTPLHWAVENGDLKVIELLLDKGATVNIKNNKGESPLDLVKRINRQDIVQILETSLNPKPQIQPQCEKLLDKQFEHKAGQVSQLLDQNINQIPRTSRQQDKFRQKGKNTNIDTHNRQEKLVNPIHGDIYRLKILMLFLYRGVSHEYSFRLGTKIKEAKKFDNLVFEYIKGDEKIYRFLQTKHKLDESKKITASNLLSESDDDYNLINYFFSYQDSKNEELFKDGSIKDVIVYTNINLNFESLKSAQIGVEKIEDKDDILDIECNKKQPMRYKFSEDVVSLLKPKLQNYGLAILKRTAEYSDNEIRDFLNHLVFAVNQPNEEELGEIIKEEIGKEFDFITTENIYNEFFIKMLNWLQGKERGMFLSYEEGKEFFKEMRRGIWFGVRDPVESFIGRAVQLDNLHRVLHGEVKTVISQTISISGLGGVGKSELARKYINKYSQKYDNIVWINAESYQTLVKSFRRLACDKLNINTKNANSKEEEIKSIVQEVYTSFSNRKSLFIFDNAEKYTSQNEFDHGIDKFLPSEPLDNYIKPYILITSRNQKWSNIQVLQLGVFDEEEATEFIKKSLNIENDAQKKYIKELANRLQFFPLALQQAVAYIRVQDENLKNVESKFTISDYLERYREKTKELLDFKFPEDSDNDYSKTILATWNVTLDMVRQRESGNDALDILNIVSYLAPEDIPIKIVLNLINDETKLSSAIELLQQYSMINYNLEHKMLNLHRLVQQVTRIQLEEQNREEEILIKALMLFDKNNVNSGNVDHAISVWNYSSRYNTLVNMFSPISSYINVELINSARYEEAYSFGLKVLELLSSPLLDSPFTCDGLLSTKNNIAGALLKLGKYDEALQMLQEICNSEEVTLGKNHSQTLNTKNSIASALGHLSKCDEALQIYRAICNIQEAALTKNHPEILLIKKNIAGMLLMQGKYNDALQTYQEVFNIEKEILGESHPDVLHTYRHIAETLRLQSKYDKALEIYQEILNKEKDIFNFDHPDILITLYNKALVLDSQGKYSDALQIYQEVLSKRKAIFGNDHPDTLKISNRIGIIYSKQGEYDKALQLYQKIYQFQTNNLGENHPDTLATKNNIGMALYGKKEYDQALQIFQEIFSKLQKLLPKHPDNLSTKNNIALVLLSQNKHDEALKTFREVLVSQEDILGEKHYSTTITKDNIAAILLIQRKHSEALKVWREVFKGFNEILGSEHPDTLRISNNIQSILMSSNDLLTAVKRNNFKRIKSLIEGGGGDVNTKDNDEITLLHYAVNNGDINIVNILLKNGADVTLITNKGNTPLHIATSKGHKDIVEVLLQYVNRNKLNDFINAKTTASGTTSLHVAAKNGYFDIIKLLLKHGAIYNIKNNEGETPFNLSKDQDVNYILKLTEELFGDAKNYNVDIISKLRAVKPDVFVAVANARNIQGNTLLQVATANKHKNIESKLLEILETSDQNLQNVNIETRVKSLKF